MVDAAKFQITCKQLKLQRKAGRLQIIQNSGPSTILWRQYGIGIQACTSDQMLQIAVFDF